MEYYTAVESEGILIFCDSIAGTEGSYAKWNKLVNKRQISYDLTYNWNLIN